MTRDASFWDWYAAKNDELRHELVERPWYGRGVTGEHDQGTFTPDDREPSIWEMGEDAPQGEGIHQGADMQELYGDPATEPPQMEQE